mgnify:CR=1 FL=1|uniref:WLM domain-containing protein n=1 Tax=viral metagenome TaxID=1070528 RepID=A0A6C0KBA7_9ZZZZ
MNYFYLKILLIIIVVAFVVWYFVFNQKALFSQQHKNIKQKASDGRTYGVNSAFGAEQKLNRFVNLRAGLDRVVKYCEENAYPDFHRSSRLAQRWAKSEIGETGPTEDTVGYVVEKGREFKICLTDKDTNALEAFNSTMFVCLHELSHLMSQEFGHGEEFWENFRVVLELAIKLGVYEYRDFKKNPDNFCGTVIYSEPCRGNTSCSKQSN